VFASPSASRRRARASSARPMVARTCARWRRRVESPARASPLSAIDGAGVDFISVKESYLDTSGPFRDVLLAFAATVARMERDRLIERTKAGLARARAQVRVGGRPRNLPLVEAALKILAEGASDEDVRKRYGEPASTLRRYRSVLRAARSSG